MDEAPGFVRLLASVDGYWLCKDVKYSVESMAVTSIETSVAEPEKTGNTAARRQFSARELPFSARGYT